MNGLLLSFQRRTLYRDDITLFFQPLCVFFVSSIVYISLYSGLQIDDTWRYTESVAAGRFQWDASHLLMQPATVIWHMIFGIGGDALSSQKAINTFSSAISFAVFFVLLRKLNVDLIYRIVLVTIAAASTYMLELGTSGHMKMTTAPWLAAALYHCVLWERAINDRSQKLADYRKHLIYAGLFLAIGTAFLINTVIVLPFLAISMWIVLAQRKEKFGDIFATASIFSSTFLAIIIPVMALGYFFSLTGRDISGFFDFLFSTSQTWDKPLLSLPTAIGQTVLTIANNFVRHNNILPITRAWVGGNLVFDTVYFVLLVKEAIYVFITLIFLLITYVYAAGVVRKFDRPVLTPLAFVLGCLSFGFWWNFHEAEFFFQITFPTLVLMTCVRPTNVMRLAVSGWAIILVTNNVFGNAIPKAVYPLRFYEQKISATFGAKDLFIHFSAWPGRHDVTQLRLPNIPQWPIDEKIIKTGSAEKAFRLTNEKIQDVFKRGGRVIVFRMLDERDWDAPWSLLPSKGVSKQILAKFFADRFRVIPIGELAQIKVWELKPL